MYDLITVLELACTDIHTLGPLIAANSGSLCSLISSMLVVSYVIILHSLKTHSSEGCCKALSTCACHVTAVILFFVCFSFLKTHDLLAHQQRCDCVFHHSTPMLNPFIYAFRNAKVKSVMKKLWGKIIKTGDK